jgi:excisionase family DNA binding protein
MSRLLSLGQAAKDLNISKDTVRRLALEGTIMHVRVSHRVMIPTTEVDRIVREGTGNPRPNHYPKLNPFSRKGVSHARRTR